MARLHPSGNKSPAAEEAFLPQVERVKLVVCHCGPPADERYESEPGRRNNARGRMGNEKKKKTTPNIGNFYFVSI